MSPNSQFIADRIQMFGADKHEAAEAVWQHPEFRTLYPEVLLAMHDVIKASVHLMDTARAAAEALGDPVCARFAPYLAEHLEEERGHDRWVLEDLERLGIPRQRALERTPSAFAAALVGAQYYWIHQAHPVALLGYLAVLEWDHPAPAFFETMAQRTGLPLAAFSTYHHHAQLDAGHRADMEVLADELPLSEAQRTLVGLSILHTSKAVADLYRGILDTSPAALSR